MIIKNVFPRFARLAVGLAVVSFCNGAVLNRSAKEATPAGLQPVDWKQIRAEYERHRHAAFPDPAGLQARNFKQQWLTRFDGRGFTVEPDGAAWRFGLERAGATGVAAMSNKLNRVTYRWSDDLDEWFLNDTRGLEHGFTLRAPQPDLRLSVRGGLTARTSAKGIEFVDASGTARVKYTGLKAWDATGRTLKASLDLEDGGLLMLHVDDRDAQYPLEIDPLVEQAALAASNLEAGDGFGSAVAISGNTLVVGARLESSNATGVNGNQTNNSSFESGAAYVFVRVGQTWTQEAYLKASNTESGDRFGGSVSISGDTVVIGAYFESSNSTGVNGAQNNNSARNSGAVYVFTRAGSVWSQQAYLKASNTRASAFFGLSVAISGNTAVFGSPSETGQGVGVDGSQSAGAVAPGAGYVFQRAGSTWTQRAYLKADVVAQIYFGSSVALSSGLTPVAGDTILVGAPVQATPTAGSAAYVFVFNGSNWTSQAKLQASNPLQAFSFGSSVALSSDTAAVGAPGENVYQDEDFNRPGGGAAYVFTRTGTTWTQQARIKGPAVKFRNPPLRVLGLSSTSNFPGRAFGRNVAMDGDRLLIDQSVATGSFAHCPNPTDSFCLRPNFIDIPTVNAVTLYTRSGSAWTVDSDFDPGGGGYSFIGGGNALAASGDSFVVGSDGSSNTNFAHVELFVPAQLITIASLPAGRFFTTTGTGCAPSTYTAPQTLSWTVGSACTVTFTTPQTGIAGVRYPFLRWEDNTTSPIRAITAPAAGAIYTGNFSTENLLTTAAGAGGTVSVGGYLLSGTTATVTATPNPGFTFVNFTGTTTSTANPFIFPITAPTTLTANFTSGTLSPNTITFPIPANTALTAGPVTVTATASSGLPVSYTSNSAAICTVSASSVTLVSTGVCSLTANQSGNATFAVATPVTVTFNVLPGTQTISFPPPTDTALSAGPVSLTGTATSALPVSFASNSAAICTVAGSSVTLVSVGVCSVTAAQGGNASFSAATPVIRTFNVTANANVIAFPQPVDTAFTAGPVPLTATSTSTLAVNYTSNSAPVCTVSGASVTLVSVGLCSITANQAGDANFVAAAPATRTFNVLPGSQTITFPQPADTALSAGPVSLAATATSGLPVALTTNSGAICTVTGTNVTLVSVGLCSITAAQTGNANFAAATPVLRTFNVTPNTNVITFPQPGSTALTGGPVVLTATATSGLTVSYASNSAAVCTVSGTSVTLVSVGLCSITANQTGNTNYAAATSVTRTFNVTAPINVVVNIASNPSGRSFAVTGIGCAPGSGVTPQIISWTPGSTCAVSFAPVQSAGVGTQFAFSNWEDSSTNPTRTIIAPSSAATYTASFITQYQLTTAAGAGGSVSAGGFFNSSATANITAMPSAGYSFLNFTGATNSVSNPLALLMDAPKSVNANFTLSAPPLLTATIVSKVDGTATNERIWTVQVTNTGAGAAQNPRIASVQILAGAPAANLGLVSLGSTVYPAALPAATLNAGQTTTLPIRIVFPATTPATRLQIRINLTAGSGYTSSITLSNVTR